tara:strand:+ start:5539 stop:6465 length:927 start_codon:yes stop_codon:yes gene_type:complete
MSYLYELEKYKTNNRFKCPKCHKNKVYTRYINSLTGEHAPYEFGKCDRLNNCNYHRYPNNNIDVTSIKHLSTVAKPKRVKCEYLSKTEYSTRLYKEFEKNYFVDYLYTKLGVKNAESVTIDYLTGTGTEGSTLFPYFDELGNLITYKTMLYSLKTGRRNKLKYGRYLFKENRYPIPLYGLHLINKYKDLNIAIVESEKTANMMRVYNPYFLWLATGGSNMLNVNKIEPIKNRKIILYPDHKQYNYWNKIMVKIKSNYPNIDISISKECEIWFDNGDIKEGEDIADYYNNNYKFSHSHQKMVKINDNNK